MTEINSTETHTEELSDISTPEYKNDQPHPLNSRYRILQELGHGAQGKIYLAKRLYDNIEVVVKQLNIHSIKNWKEYELFHRESKVLESLLIPGVARFYDAIDCLEDDPPCSYIVQEYIHGESLQKKIEKGHRFKVNDVYDILIQTLEILDRLHHHTPPIIHRDIKPSNIMISADKKGKLRVTVIDFGAVANPQVQGGGSTVAGTFGYMPPEQLTGNPVPASDIYALAAMAVQLFCGKAPGELPTKDFRLIFEPELQNNPHELVSLLGQMLNPNVDQRLSDIHEIIQRFQNIRLGRILTLETKHSKNYTTVFKKKLSEVRSIGQNGNVELWQQLPDTLPRPIPDFYANIINKYSNAVRLLVHQKFNENSINKLIISISNLDTKFDNFMNLLFYVIVISFLITGVISLVMFIVFSIFDLSIRYAYYFFPALTALAFVVLILCVILRIIMNIFSELLPIPVKINKQMTHTNRFGISPEDLVIQMHNLLVNGRKSIAKIDKIEYLQMMNPESVKALVPNTRAYFLADKPLFKIWYRFNPPDDKRAEDIIHTFITQSEPENHYRIGDPLPILYYIEDHEFYDVVTSMPFPLSDLDLNDHAVGLIVDSSYSS